MYQWQNSLKDGNEYFNDGKYLQAEYYYKEAQSYLEMLWAEDKSNVQLLMAWICTLHNLSALFEHQGQTQMALQYLLIPHNRMLVMSQENKHCEDHQIIALNALKITFNPLLLFSKKYPICDSCQKTIEAFKSKLNMQQAVVH